MLDQTTKLSHKTYHGVGTDMDFIDSEIEVFIRFAGIDKPNFIKIVDGIGLPINKPKSIKIVLVTGK